MWTTENCGRYDRNRLRYPSDLTDEEWMLVEPLSPPAKRGGDKRTVDVREVVNALMYVLSTGCQWRAIPKDLPPRSTVHGYFDLWSWDGTLDRIHHELYIKCREAIGREASPTAAVIDFRSVKSAEKGGPTIRRGTTLARARSVTFVDTQGLLIHAIVHAADIQDRDGGELVMATMFGMFPFLLKLYADGGYQGPLFRPPSRKSWLKSTSRSSSAPVKRRPSSSCRGGGSSSELSPGSDDAEGSPRIGKSQPQGARFPAPRLHQAYVEKAMQSRINSSDRL